MTVYVVTGKLGGGKTLCSVGRIRDKLRAGCAVATNLDLNLCAMFGASSRHTVLRVPDKPTRDDLDALGCGNPSYDESRNGLLVLDELGTWLNSRAWQDKSRSAVIDWFLHARKLGWDLILIVQDIGIMDSQARDALAEMVVYCRRLDRIKIPIIGSLFKLFTGSPLPLPRVHVAAVRYGSEANALASDTWVYRGNDLFDAYDTRQAFLVDYPHGVYSVLPPWHVRGWRAVPRNWGFYMRMTRIYWRRLRSPVAVAAGLLAGVALTSAAAFAFGFHDYTATRRAQAATLERMQAIEAEAMARLVSSPGVSSPAVGRIDAMRDALIVAWIGAGERSRYIFETGDGVTVSSADLEMMGFSVFGHSRCEATIRFGADTVRVTCPLRARGPDSASNVKPALKM